ncbi:MAG: CidA/LrgA family protein [Bermanella sp.]
MLFINGLTILLLYQLMGEVTVRWLDIPVPGPVLAMIMLFVSLVIKGSTPSSLQSSANTILSHLSLLFIPAGVGIMAHFDRLQNEWLPISVAIILSTVITLIFSAAVMLTMNKLFNFSSDIPKKNSEGPPIKSLEQLQKELIENESDHG